MKKALTLLALMAFAVSSSANVLVGTPRSMRPPQTPWTCESSTLIWHVVGDTVYVTTFWESLDDFAVLEVVGPGGFHTTLLPPVPGWSEPVGTDLEPGIYAGTLSVFGPGEQCVGTSYFVVIRRKR
jgi:hypothetical protein